MKGYINKSFRYWNTVRYLKLIQIIARIKFFFPSKKTKLNRNNHKNEIINSWIKSPKSYIANWIKENLPFHGIGWEPYPTSLRIVNWIKWSINGGVLSDQWLCSLEVQVRFLSKNIEYHLLGNHIFANAKALIFAGLFFQGKEANRWYSKGKKLIDKELSEQILPDGGNFELSPMYHSIFLEDMLDLVNIHRIFEKQVPKNIEEKIPLMLDWLNIMCHPDGEISFFNDAASGIAPSLKELQHYAMKLSIKYPLENKARIAKLDNSGYSRVQYGNLVALIDRSSIGPDYLPAHAHADTLSFELSISNQRVIVNSGTSIYGESEERQVQRGTNSHSTLMIDGEDSSEVWSGFRVARRAKILNSFECDYGNKITLSASHNGYHRLQGKPTHFRKWDFFREYLLIEDHILGKGSHDIDIIFPLHPLVNLLNSSNDEIILGVNNKNISVKFEGAGTIVIEDSKYHSEFGLSINNLKIRYQITQTLPVIIRTRISW